MSYAALLLPILLAGPVAPPPEVEAATVVHEWDDRRAAAWATGDAADLARLYTPGSAVGRADVRMLREWRARGVVVHGMTTQLLRVDVRRAGGGRLVLDLRDRLVAGVAVGPGVRLRLPVGRPTSRRVVLERRQGEWLMAQSVEDRPARITSWTVRSRKE